MADPQGVCIDFDADTMTETPSWTRVDSITGIAINEWRIDRGRTVEFDKTETGTATVTGTDTSGELDPTNAGSTYVGKINPGKPFAIALQNPVDSSYSTLIRGNVANFQHELDEAEGVFRWTIEAEGPFAALAAFEMTPGNAGDTAPGDSIGDVYFNEDSGLDAVQTRINKILDDVGWPSGLREIFTGNVGLQGSVYSRLENALTAMYDAADAEFPGVANVFERKDGYIVFHGRLARFNPTDESYNINFWTVGDDAACALDATCARLSPPLQFNRGKDRLINASMSLPQGVADTDVPGNLVTDPTSIGEYGWRVLSFDNLLTLNGDGTDAITETQKFSQYYVDNYAQPMNRIEPLTLKSQHPAGPFGTPQWAFICGIDISDVVTVTTTHPGGGGFSDDFFIEGVHYICRPAAPDYPDIELTLDLSPRAAYNTNPF